MKNYIIIDTDKQTLIGVVYCTPSKAALINSMNRSLGIPQILYLR